MKLSSFLAVLAIAVLVLSAIPSHDEASAVVVRPNRLDHFVLQIPDAVRAGQEFVIRIQAYDAYGNLITNFADTGKDIQVSVSGEAEVKPSVIKAVSLGAGEAGITILHKKAEDIVIALYEAGGTVPIYTSKISIAPNKLDHFVIKSPLSAEAGQGFEVRIFARDAFENTVRDAELAGDIKVSSGGDVEIKNIQTPQFEDGMGIIQLTVEKTGRAALEVKDTASGIRSKSEDITIIPSMLDHFSVGTGQKAEAGTPFDILITAVDKYGNIASNYSSYGGGITLASSGSGRIMPSQIKPAEFKDGQARVSLTYEKAEDITLTAIENNRTQQGKSPLISISPADVERFTILTPDDAVAGQKFRIKIEAYDRFDNLIKNYNIKGGDVVLSVAGNGTLKPDMVSASEFVNGTAGLDVLYDKAESIIISASVSSGEKALPKDKPPAALKDKETATPKDKTAPPEKQPAEDKTKKAPLQVKKPKEKEPLKVVKKEEPRVETPEKPKKLFEVSDINIIEAQNKALMVIKIPGISSALSYKDSLEFSDGKDWVKIKLSPVVNRVKKPLSFKSAFIGEVKVKDGVFAKELYVLFEILPAKVKYELKAEDDSLVISITPF